MADTPDVVRQQDANLDSTAPMGTPEFMLRIGMPSALGGLSLYSAVNHVSDDLKAVVHGQPAIISEALTGVGHIFPGYVGAGLGEAIAKRFSKTNEISRRTRSISQTLGMTAVNLATEVTQSLVDGEGLTGQFLGTHAARLETGKDYLFAIAGMLIYRSQAWAVNKWFPNRPLLTKTKLSENQY